MKNKNVKNLVHLLENTNHIWSSGVCVLDRERGSDKLYTFTYGIRVELARNKGGNPGGNLTFT